MTVIAEKVECKNVLDPIAHFTVSKLSSVARDLLICAVMLATYLIVGLILFLTETINLGSFLFFFVGISVFTALICTLILLRQGKTEYFVYTWQIKIRFKGKEHELSYSDIEEVKLKHCLINKSKGTIEFIPYEKYRRRDVRFCFKNLPNVDKLYEVLHKLYLSGNSSSLTVSEWLDFNLSDENFDDVLTICFNVGSKWYNKRFDYEVRGDYVTTENYEGLADCFGEGLVPEIDEIDKISEFEELPYMDEFWNELRDHPFNAQNDDEAYEFIKEELLKYIENGQYSDRLKKCKAVFITDEHKFEKIY